jgi:hypothetical protein
MPQSETERRREGGRFHLKPVFGRAAPGPAYDGAPPIAMNIIRLDPLATPRRPARVWTRDQHNRAARLSVADLDRILAPIPWTPIARPGNDNVAPGPQRRSNGPLGCMASVDGRRSVSSPVLSEP